MSRTVSLAKANNSVRVTTHSGTKKKYPKKDKGKKWTSEQFWGSFLFGGSKKDEIRKDLMERSVVSEETLNDFPTFPYVGVR